MLICSHSGQHGASQSESSQVERRSILQTITLHKGDAVVSIFIM